MKAVMTTPTGRTTRWAVQVAIALVFVGLLAGSTMTGASAANVHGPVQDEELLCLHSGGQWIELVDDKGNITSVACAYDTGTIITCSPLATICRTEGGLSSPATPSKDVPAIVGTGGDLGLSPDPATRSDAPIEGVPALAVDQK